MVGSAPTINSACSQCGRLTHHVWRIHPWVQRARAWESRTENGLRFVHDLSPGHAHDAKSAGGEGGVTTAVAFEHLVRPMESEAVDFNDEPFAAPKEIDLDTANGCVGGRSRQLPSSQKGEEPVLGLGTGERGRSACGEHGSQQGRAGSTVMALEEREQLIAPNDFIAFGARDRVLEIA